MHGVPSLSHSLTQTAVPKKLKSDDEEISSIEWQELEKNGFFHFLSIDSF